MDSAGAPAVAPNPYLPYPPDPASAAPAYANPNSTLNPGHNPGARLMQLLGTDAPLHSTPPLTQSTSSDFSGVAPPLSVSPSLARMASSSRMPRGRLLLDGPGDRVVHEVHSRLHSGEARPPQLEVTPITKYTSDPGLVLGRQIALNRTYIVYGLKLGNIRVLNFNTALRSLLHGHRQVGRVPTIKLVQCSNSIPKLASATRMSVSTSDWSPSPDSSNVMPLSEKR